MLGADLGITPYALGGHDWTTVQSNPTTPDLPSLQRRSFRNSGYHLGLDVLHFQPPLRLKSGNPAPEVEHTRSVDRRPRRSIKSGSPSLGSKRM